MSSWKSMIVRATVEYLLNFVYLAFFLVAFAWYRRLILAEYAIPYLNYGSGSSRFRSSSSGGKI